MARPPAHGRGRQPPPPRHTRSLERDRRRDQQLTAAGWRVVRFTWRQVVDEPDVVVATLRSLLAC